MGASIGAKKQVGTLPTEISAKRGGGGREPVIKTKLLKTFQFIRSIKGYYLKLIIAVSTIYYLEYICKTLFYLHFPYMDRGELGIGTKRKLKCH